MKEGIIKFNCNLIKGKNPETKKITELNKWRNKLIELKLIGVTINGIGYGNISIRTEKNRFLISGSGTGEIEKLKEEHYCEVTEFNFHENSLTCVGQIKASSESLTHAAIYESFPEINAVIHAHNLKLWNFLLEKVPFTGEKAEYGSPEMAEEIKRLLGEEKTREKKIIVMKGHKEGVVSFGKTLDEAGKILLDFFEETK